MPSKPPKCNSIDREYNLLKASRALLAELKFAPQDQSVWEDEVRALETALTQYDPGQTIRVETEAHRTIR